MPPPLRKILPLLLIPFAAQAEEIFITNAGFEDPGLAIYNEFSFGPPPGWSLYDPDIVTNGGSGPNYYLGTLQPTEVAAQPGVIQYFPNGAPEGSRVGIAFNAAVTGGGGEWGFQQTLGATLQANTTYTLTVRVGNIASGLSVDGSTFNLDGFPGYRIDFLAGGEVLESDENSLALSLGEGQFGLSTITFTTTATPNHENENLSIRLVNLNVVDASFPTADLEVDFDDVRLTTTAVPEPAASAILLGACCVLLSRRSRRQS